MLVTARKLNDLDENELGTSDIPEPKQIEGSTDNFTASEASSADALEVEIVEEDGKK
jgi:DNA recombination protein RmuC